MIQNSRSLLWAVSVGTLEIHPFLATAPNFDSPTQIVFDLDPGEAADILTCAEVAFLLRDILARLGLQSFVKVSGSKGLQVYVPLNTPTSYAFTQPFARTVAELLAREHPRLVVAAMEKAQRKRRVFIDWSQNADYKTTVAVYSLRAKRRHPYVSMPVTWEELREACDRKEAKSLFFQADAAIERLKRLGDLFAPLLTLRQQLPETFTHELGIAHRKTRVPRGTFKTAKTPRASAQGGRRRFALIDGRLVVELHDMAKAWPVSHMPGKDGQSVAARAAEDLTSDDAERIFRSADTAEVGTVELIEGNFRKGYLDLHFSGERVRGEWELVRRADQWQLIKPQPGESHAPESFWGATLTAA